MSAARTVAQGKINLFLRVGELLPNGYHEIYTLFQRLELGDVVTVRTGGETRSIDTRGADVGPAEKNLAWRAAVDYATRTGWPRGFAIEIEKRIPVGGGLGGGSADAAAVLRILNRLAPLPLGAAELAELALRLGADVPFLLSDHSLAIGRGRGEYLTPLEPLPQKSVRLLVMPFGVSTRDAYGWIDASRAGAEEAQRTGDEELWWTTWNDVVRLYRNDFEAVVAERHAVIAQTLGELRASGALVSGMSGSGATLFAVHESSGGIVNATTANGVTLIQTTTGIATAPIEYLGQVA